MFKIKKLILICLIYVLSGCASSEVEPVPKGWVLLSFDIDSNGNPINIKVLESNPSIVFDKEAVIALEKWKFKPKVVNGVPVAQKEMQVRLDFELNDEN
jgi:protein TonB